MNYLKQNIINEQGRILSAYKLFIGYTLPNCLIRINKIPRIIIMRPNNTEVGEVSANLDNILKQEFEDLGYKLTIRTIEKSIPTNFINGVRVRIANEDSNYKGQYVIIIDKREFIKIIPDVEKVIEFLDVHNISYELCDSYCGYIKNSDDIEKAKNFRRKL